MGNGKAIIGTRHNIQVTVNDKIKISQYGQWDGYFTGQGQGIVDFLKKTNLKEFRKKVWALHVITKGEIKEASADPSWSTHYPWLSRDAGCLILDYVMDGSTKSVLRNEDMSWCEFLYNIDLDKETVTVNDMVFPFSIWTADGFMDQLEEMENELYEEE